MGIWYCTREDVVSALGDTSATSRGFAGLDRAIDSGARAVESLTHRKFYPQAGTRAVQRMVGERLYLDENEVVSVSGISIDSDTLGVNDWTLSPADGPPFTSIVFPDGPALSYRGDLLLTGVFGACDDQVAAGTTIEALDLVETGVDVSDGSLIGVGDVLKVDSERMIVTGRTWISTGQTLSAPITASNASTVVGVQAGVLYGVGESILLDAEQMLIVDIAGNNLMVKRAYNGTVLAAHTGSTVFASRTLTVTRGALGSTVATHLTSAPITRLQAPGLVRSMAVAEAINFLLQDGGGWAREVGAGDNAREMSGNGLREIRRQTYAAHGRKARFRTVG